MMGKNKENAVSPVVGVMLMLVVTIIIAAIVSAFAGGAMSGQKKVPQATITGKFSIANGIEITHAGGDALATSEISFMIRDNAVFGPNLEQMTAQVLDKKNITNSNGKTMQFADGSMDFTSFAAGDTLYISADNTSCNILQPGICPNSGVSGATYSGSKAALWALCIRNSDNIGKTFSLEVSDKKGNLISKSDVTIAA